MGRTNKRKAALMKALGVNLIRVQSVKASSDHSGCMSAFENAGIYVLLDFNSFRSSFDAVRIPQRPIGLAADADKETRLLQHGQQTNIMTAQQSWTRLPAIAILSDSSPGMNLSRI
jgi:hypothetical protein